MIKYIYFAIVSLTIVTLFQIQNIFTPKSFINIKIKLLPIILAILLGIISVTKQQSFKHFELSNELRENNENTIDKHSLHEHNHDININSSNIDLSKDSNNIYEEGTDKVILINDNNSTILEDIRINPSKYIGRELELQGFICKEDYLNKNQFIIGRIIMTCCAADSKAVGIIAEYNNASKLKENQNVNVRGTIGITNIKDDKDANHSVPVLLIKDLKTSN